MIIQGNDPSCEPSFSLAHRVRRQVWNIMYTLFFRTSPRTFHSWRALLLRAFGATLGEGCHIYPQVKIWAPWNLHLGKRVGIADGVTLYSMDKIIIGDAVVISDGAYLCGGTHDYNSENFQLIIKPIVIGAYAWICAEVFIHPGVTIPVGAVVGSRSVVTKNLLTEWGVYTGNPCRQVNVRRRLK